MSQMQTGSRIRNLARALDATGVIFWWIGGDGRIRYVSGAAAKFLGVCDADDLVGCFAVSGVAPVENFDAQDAKRAAALLAPPPGIQSVGWRHSWVISPIEKNGQTPVHHVAVADGGCVGIGGKLATANDWTQILEATRTREILDQHRRGSAARFDIVTAGTSRQALLTKRRIELATETTTDLTLSGVRGCESETIAHGIAKGDVAKTNLVDGSIMDAELLEASLGATIDGLNQDEQVREIVIVRDADEMPADAQSRLIHWKTLFGQRLRLIALTGVSVGLNESTNSAIESSAEFDGLLPSLADHVMTLQISLTPIAQRPRDLPLIAAAVSDMVSAEAQFSRSLDLSSDCIRQLISFPWPGDVSELVDSVRSACRDALKKQQLKSSEPSDVLVKVENLPLVVRSYQPGRKKVVAVSPPLDLTVRQHEADRISVALDQSDGNRAAAARSLGISRARLLRKLDELVAAHLLTEDGCRRDPE